MRPHTLEEKRKAYPQSPSGMPIVENSLCLMLNEVHRGRCSLEQVVQWMCDAPARVWDIVDKGRIEEGYDADLAGRFNRRHTIRNAEQLTKCGWVAVGRRRTRRPPGATWVRGQVVYCDGRTNDAVRGAAAQFDHARGGYWAS